MESSTTTFEQVLDDLTPRDGIDRTADLEQKRKHPGRKFEPNSATKRFGGALKGVFAGTEIEAQAKKEFHNYSLPCTGVLKERDSHRIVIHLRSEGKSCKDIFEILGGTYDDNGEALSTGQFSLQTIRNLVRQPWFVVRVATILREHGRDVLQDMIKTAAVDSVQTIIELRDTAKSESVKASCAFNLVDRFLGKPAQHIVEHKEKPDRKPLDKINAEWDDLTKKEQQLRSKLEHESIQEIVA